MQGVINVRSLMDECQRERDASNKFWERMHRDAEYRAIKAWFACTAEEEREEVRRTHEPYLSSGLAWWKKVQRQKACDQKRIYDECVRRGWIAKGKLPY